MSKSCLSLFLLVTLLLLNGCGPPPIDVDPEDFVGTWQINTEDRLIGTLTFKEDGTFFQEVKTNGPMEILLIGDMNFSGTWTVKNGYLMAEVTESTNTTQAPIGKKFRDWIREFVPEDHYIVETPQGFLEEYHWVPQEPGLESIQNEGKPDEEANEEEQ